MQIGPLDLPDDLLTALEEKRLVVFAGAGVSIPPPANLLSFKGLVEDIIKRTLSEDEEGQMDRVLGREKDKGIPIHQLAAKRLSDPASRFNSLHESLVTLFGSPSTLRIVTTNFDPHFEGAISAHPPMAGAQVYRAPALPVGSSFTGLVHLHGNLGQAAEQLVLTDADFGRAYLSEGWAGRFVLELFRQYTVLFVGYSYSDTVMSYLTRGLSPLFGPKRFALDKLGQREKWELLGIQVIEYDPADDHRALAEGLSQWASLELRGFLDWSQRLPGLVGREPRALAPDEKGELDFCLKNPKRAKLFYQHAKAPGWLEWAEESGRLQPLFSLEENQDALYDLALWFTDEPLGERGKLALQLALKAIRPVSRTLAFLASQQVYRVLAEIKVTDKTQGHLAAAWASLLIKRTPPQTPLFLLGYWLEHLSPAEHPHLTVQILAHLLRCDLAFREAWLSDQGSALGLSLDTPTLAGRDLSYYWKKLRPFVGALAWPLIPVITEVFEERWRWRVCLTASTPINDPWGWDRPWVERPPGESNLHDSIHAREVGPLLDIGKEAVDELLAAAPERATAVIEQWLAASAPQLVQLGLYGLAKSGQWKPAKKVERLVAKHLPAKLPFKVETFRVLRESYPWLSPRQRERFLKRACRLHRREVAEREDEPERHRSAVYEWFNLLVWLDSAAPGDPLLEGAIASVHQIYPEFKPRPHPELDIEHGEARWVQPKSVLKSEEIAGLTLPQWREELAAAVERQQRADFSDHVRGFLEETARAASESLEWGLTFARGLIENGDLAHQVWAALLAAWADRPFTPDEWRKVLRVLDEPGLLAAQAHGITDVVRSRSRQKDPQASVPMLRSGLQLAEKLLPLAEAIPFTILSENEDWLTQAINHPGGQIAEYLIEAIGRQLGPNPPRGCGVPRPYKRLLHAMTGGTGNASALGRVVLASNVHYFLWIDPDWTRANLVPLFDWNLTGLQAARAWHGFLFWGQPGAALLEALTTVAVQLATHLEDLGSARENYGKFIARAAYSLPDDPLDKAWFKAFLASANDDDRVHFTWQINRKLESLSPEQRTEVWRGWLCRYLERRAQSPPTPEGKELTALFDWPFNLPGQLSELTERLEALPGGGAAIDSFTWKIQEGQLAGSDASLLARLLLALLKHCEKVETWQLSQLWAALKRLLAEGARTALIRELVEKYLEHGGSGHQELLDELGRRGT